MTITTSTSELTQHPLKYLTGFRPWGTGAGGARLGQTFQVPQDCLVGHLAVYLRSVGSPTDNLTAVIESDYQGYPTYVPPAQALYSDTFTGTDGTTLPNYDARWRADRQSITIQSNQAKAVTLNSITVASVETGTVNQIIESDIIIPAVPGAYPNDWLFGICGRLTDYQNMVYVRILYQDDSPEIELWDVVNAVGTLIFHNRLKAGTYTPGDTHHLRLWLNGTTASAYLDNGLKTDHVNTLTPNSWVSGTTSVVTGTRAGLLQYDGITTQLAKWDNFTVYPGTANNVSGTVPGATVSPTGGFVVFSFNPPVVLKANTDYHWHLRRSGSNSYANYYALGIDNQGRYAHGDAEIYDSTQTTNAATSQTSAPFWATLADEAAIFALLPGQPLLYLPAASITKATARKELSFRVRDWLNATTTGAGSTSTVVCSALIGYGDDYFNGQWVLLTSGSASGQWRLITDFVSSTGTLTVAPVFSAASGNTTTFELHTHRPDLYTVAVNEAIRQCYPAIYRQLLSYGDYPVQPSDGLYGGVPRTRMDHPRPLLDRSWQSLLAERTTPLTLLAEDTTYGTIASDSTSTLEMETTDPAWEVLMAYAKAALYQAASQPAGDGDAASLERYAMAAGAAAQEATVLRARLRMPRASTPVRYAGDR